MAETLTYNGNHRRVVAIGKHLKTPLSYLFCHTCLPCLLTGRRQAGMNTEVHRYICIFCFAKMRSITTSPGKEDQFFLKEVEAQIKFTRNEKKEVSGMMLLQNGKEKSGKKDNA